MHSRASQLCCEINLASRFQNNLLTIYIFMSSSLSSTVYEWLTDKELSQQRFIPIISFNQCIISSCPGLRINIHNRTDHVLLNN